jgi:hypothetical protein
MLSGYIRYVIRTIHVIKFAIDWKEKESTAEGRGWKHNYRQKLFDREQNQEVAQIEATCIGKRKEKKLIGLCRRFGVRHEKLVTARNHIRKLYEMVCPEYA